jgi:hypothetical protein
VEQFSQSSTRGLSVYVFLFFSFREKENTAIMDNLMAKCCPKETIAIEITLVSDPL